MSIVGTRPPTLDEWNKYELHHRARLAIKPGITGMWQVSGRSEITDFEEVVKLDTEYISEWNVWGIAYRMISKLTYCANPNGSKYESTMNFSDAAAHHRPQMDRVQDVPDSLRLLYELHGESGAWQRKSVVWQTYWSV